MATTSEPTLFPLPPIPGLNVNSTFSQKMDALEAHYAENPTYWVVAYTDDTTEGMYRLITTAEEALEAVKDRLINEFCGNLPHGVVDTNYAEVRRQIAAVTDIGEIYEILDGLDSDIKVSMARVSPGFSLWI